MKNHSMSNFEGRSLLLFSALVLGPAFATDALAATAPCMAEAFRTAQAVPTHRASVSSAQAAFNRADTNGDGKLSRQEAEHFPAMAPHFLLIDTNHDGFLSFDELMRAASDI